MGRPALRQVRGLRVTFGWGRLRASHSKDVALSLIARLILAVGLVALSPAALHADEIADPGKIEQMAPKELESFVDLVTATVAQDTLKLRDAGTKGDCIELARLANSFALGYSYLGTADDSVDVKANNALISLKVKIVQSRVITFAARVRAEEWNRQRCASYAPSAENADNPRYQVPAKIQTNEFAEAVIEGRQAAEANLAGAVAAARTGQCTTAIGAARSLQMLVPYLDKLLIDISTRPEALGPRASRRGLQAARNQVASAFNQLDTVFSGKCGAPPAEPQPAPELTAP